MDISIYENKVIHCNTQKEVDTLISILEKENYEYAIPFKSLSEYAKDFIAKDGYDGCWRISETKGIAYNPDQSHWKEYGYEVIEMKEVLKSI